MVNAKGRIWRSGLCVGAIALLGGPVQAASFQNGSFENPAGGNVLLTIHSTFATGWVVGMGTIDRVTSPWAATDGTHSIDLNGNSASGLGSRLQTFDTIDGHS